MSKQPEKKGFTIPKDVDYTKVYGNINYNPSLITCSCGTCNKDYKISQVSQQALAELNW